MSDSKYNEDAYKRVRKLFKVSETENNFFFCNFTSDLEKKGISLLQKCSNYVIINIEREIINAKL